jgi:hypothetical protein
LVRPHRARRRNGAPLEARRRLEGAMIGAGRHAGFTSDGARVIAGRGLKLQDAGWGRPPFKSPRQATARGQTRVWPARSPRLFHKWMNTVGRATICTRVSACPFEGAPRFAKGVGRRSDNRNHPGPSAHPSSRAFPHSRPLSFIRGYRTGPRNSSCSSRPSCQKFWSLRPVRRGKPREKG